MLKPKDQAAKLVGELHQLAKANDMAVVVAFQYAEKEVVYAAYNQGDFENGLLNGLVCHLCHARDKWKREGSCVSLAE